MREVLPSLWEETSFGALSGSGVAELSLLREFARRPKRQNSLETLGLVGLRYKALKEIQRDQLPAVWRSVGGTVERWREFLTFLLDQVFRGRSACAVPPGFQNWMGVPISSRFVVGPDATIQLPRRQVLWPLVRKGRRIPQAALVLSRWLGLTVEEPRINEVLREAWVRLTRLSLITQSTDGYQLSFQDIELHEVDRGWICPITHTIFAHVFDGQSPYAPTGSPIDQFRCSPVQMPRLPQPFWRRSDGSGVERREREEWLADDAAVRSVRDLGLWTEISDRIAANVPYFRVVEHSAQIESALLRQYERDFKRGFINLLSCSTTMEMGVDIGGLSAIGLNNPPPSPANFQQRVGRAGRRDEAVSVSLTLCNSTPHGQEVFRNPVWPLTAPNFTPRVSLQSERIVDRHVNSLLLRLYFVSAGAANPHRLTTGWFFGDLQEIDSPSSGFINWLHGPALADKHVESATTRLVEGTALAGLGTSRLLARAAARLFEIRQGWLAERDGLRSQRDELGGDSPNSKNPAILAVERALQRVEGEFLLGFLAAHRFLPGYGFPTSVVPFITTTAQQLEHERRQNHEGREDLLPRRRSYPSRELTTALREFAPGAEVVLGGRVYSSAGLTLNWKIPHTDEEVREVQSIQMAWICRQCGGSGSSRRLLQSCPYCDADEIALRQHEFLSPSGFAVDLSYQPHNRISESLGLPSQTPWMTAAGSPWVSLPVSRAGRFRYSVNGHVFHHTRGANGFGYAVCLRCGRAASEIDASSPELPGISTSASKAPRRRHAFNEWLLPR